MGFNAKVFTVTNAGFALFARAQNGGVIQFTRFALGDGDIGDMSTSTLTALISERASAAIESRRVSGTRCTLSTKLLMIAVTAPFYWRELGIFATDGETEVLYAHASTGTPEYVDPAGGTTDKILSAQLEVGTAQITIQIMPSAMLVNFDDLDRATSPEALLEKIKQVDGEGSGLDADLLDGKSASEFVPNTRKVNGKSLNSDITLSASDVGANNAANITTGTLDAARLPTVPVEKGGTGNTTGKAKDSEKLGGQLPGYYQDKLLQRTVTLAAGSAWANNQQTVSVPGVTADSSKTIVWVGPATASKEAYDGAGIYASGQGANTLTFTCMAAPSIAVQVNVAIAKVGDSA